MSIKWMLMQTNTTWRWYLQAKSHMLRMHRALSRKHAIADYLSDICQREMTHRVMDEVIGENPLSFNEACQYPGGERVLAATVLDLQNGKISVKRQESHFRSAVKQVV